ncbi:MAG: A24 family peptidase [Chloroflexota bacterium]|nr:A24 family peptidase [Chloroflexota bacterium]
MAAVIVLTAWLVGVLANYFSDILPVRRRLDAPLCLGCGEMQPGWNYWVWPRRCPACGKPRSLRVWVVEIVYIGVGLWLWNSHPEEIGYLLGMLLLLYFGVVIIIDVEHRLILYPVSIVGAVIGLGLGIWRHGLVSTLLGGAAGFACMLILYLLGGVFIRWMARLRGKSSDEVALGFGDVTLSGVLGLMLGWPGIMMGLLLAVLLGGTVSLLFIVVMLIARRYNAFTPIPYGPFLVAAAVLLLFFREAVMGLLI